MARSPGAGDFGAPPLGGGHAGPAIVARAIIVDLYEFEIEGVSVRHPMRLPSVLGPASRCKTVPTPRLVGTATPVKNVRVTKGGMVVLAVLAAALVISLLTTGTARFLAVGTIAFVVLLLIGEGLSGPGTPYGAEAADKREVLSRNARKRRFDDAP
jgi:hypothetical protein